MKNYAPSQAELALLTMSRYWPYYPYIVKNKY